MGLTPSKISCQRRAPGNSLSLNHLGDELFCNLCHDLDVASLGSVACSSRHFRAQLRKEEAWRQALGAFGAANVQQLRGMLTLSAPRWRSLPGGDGAVPRARDHHIAFGATKGLIIFGGNDFSRGHMMSDTWLLDAKTKQWRLAATVSGPRPSPRTFNADGGGGGILWDQKTQREWMVIYGGLRGEGYRDNETWLLGPLDLDCAQWRWQEIEAGGGPQSRLRPTPRFHHTQTVLGDSTLAVLGGHDFMIRPILAAGLLKLHEANIEGDEEIEWELLSDSQDGPVPRAYHSAVHWRGGALVLFGGVTRPGTARSQFGLQVHRDTWILDTETPRPTWSRLPAEFIGTLDGGRCHATASILKDRFLAIAGGCERVAGLQGDDGWIMAGLQVRPDFWSLDLENPQSWQKLLDLDRPAWWDSSSVVIHERTMLIFGGHDSSEVNEFDDPMGGYASKDDALLLRVNTDGGLVTAVGYCGEEPGREACYSSLVTLPGSSRVLCCCADETGDEMQAFELCHGDD